MKYYFLGEPVEIPHLTEELLLNAPKIKRTHIYVCPPYMYDICCPLCGASSPDKFTYSEYEYHYWCYNCEKDITIPHIYAGIFGGPIPEEVCESFGISFDRKSLIDGAVIRINQDNTNLNEYKTTWVSNKELTDYCQMLDDLCLRDEEQK